MLLTAMGAAILGEWAEGVLLLFLFSLGRALEHFTTSLNFQKRKNTLIGKWNFLW